MGRGMHRTGGKGGENGKEVSWFVHAIFTGVIGKSEVISILQTLYFPLQYRPFICGFSLHGFGYLWSATVGKTIILFVVTKGQW